MVSKKNRIQFGMTCCSFNLQSSSTPSSQTTIDTSPRAYRAQGLQVSNEEGAQKTIESLWKNAQHSPKVTILSFARHSDGCTCVFEFSDGIPPSPFEKDYPVGGRRYVTIDSNFSGMTILHQPAIERKDQVESAIPIP